jgi:hypothetical protein
MDTNTTMMDMWQQPTGWYKIIPYIKEGRGNLKCMGIQAPLCINDVGGLPLFILRRISHIKIL